MRDARWKNQTAFHCFESFALQHPLKPSNIFHIGVPAYRRLGVCVAEQRPIFRIPPEIREVSWHHLSRQQLLLRWTHQVFYLGRIHWKIPVFRNCETLGFGCILGTLAFPDSPLYPDVCGISVVGAVGQAVTTLVRLAFPKPINAH